MDHPFTAIDLPFSSDEFIAAWNAWLDHRRETKKKLTPTSVRMQFKKLAAMGEARAIAAIEHSIASGYQGIFEENKTIRALNAGPDRAATFLSQGSAIQGERN